MLCEKPWVDSSSSSSSSVSSSFSSSLSVPLWLNSSSGLPVSMRFSSATSALRSASSCRFREASSLAPLAMLSMLAAPRNTFDSIDAFEALDPALESLDLLEALVVALDIAFEGAMEGATERSDWVEPLDINFGLVPLWLPIGLPIGLARDEASDPDVGFFFGGFRDCDLLATDEAREERAERTEPACEPATEGALELFAEAEGEATSEPSRDGVDFVAFEALRELFLELAFDPAFELLPFSADLPPFREPSDPFVLRDAVVDLLARRLTGALPRSSSPPGKRSLRNRAITSAAAAATNACSSGLASS